MEMQQGLIERERWIMDGDLGPYDIVEVRLRSADTVIFLDFSFVRCAWRPIRRFPERADFWRWLFACRRRSRPLLFKAVAAYAANADSPAQRHVQVARALSISLPLVRRLNRSPIHVNPRMR